MDHTSTCSLEKSGVQFEDQNQSNQQWPLWLPSDWFIHRDTNTPHPQVYYSNPKGKTFYSEEEVTEYLAKEKEKTEKSSVAKKRRTKRKGLIHDEVDDADKPEEVEVDALSCFDIYPEWPDWLPNDWYIEEDVRNPDVVYYCSPKWKKFRTKEEVTQHVEAEMSKKTKTKASKTARKRMKKVL